MKIAFAGLGKMGLPMATRLLGAGHEVTAVVRSRRGDHDSFEAAGGRFASTPRAAAEDAGAAILMVPGPAEVAAVVRGEDGLLAGLARGSAIIDCATSLPDLTRELQAEAAGAGIAYVDAPVIGGPPVAAEGGLQFLVGAADADFATVLPLLQIMGKEIIHIGEPGAGHAAKVVNNMIALSNMAVLGEGLAMSAKLGLDAEKMLQVLSKGFGSSYVSQRHMPKIINGDFTPTFTLTMGLKDLTLADDLARQLGYPLFLAGTARESFQLGRVLGFGDQNYTAVTRVFESYGKELRRSGAKS